MAYDENLCDRVRASIGAQRGLSEIKMFGGFCFTINGNMACGVLGPDLIVRVSKEDHERFIAEPGARPFDFMKGRSPVGIMFVSGKTVAKKPGLDKWVKRSVDHASSLPPKSAKASKPKKTASRTSR